MTRKEKLIKSLIEDPQGFNTKEIKELLKLKKTDKFTYSDLRPILLRIFDLNADTVINKSTAAKGVMGFLNKRSRRKKEKKFWLKAIRGLNTPFS